MEEEGRNLGCVSLDDLTERNLAKADPAMFFQLHPPPVLVDEVQYAPELFPYIKLLVDQNLRPGDFWLTGSQLFKLMSGVRESLAGRVALLHMSPLSQREICGRETVPFNLDVSLLSEQQKDISPVSTPEIFDRIFRGGMPALLSGKYEDRSIFYSRYIST